MPLSAHSSVHCPQWRVTGKWVEKKEIRVAKVMSQIQACNTENRWHALEPAMENPLTAVSWLLRIRLYCETDIRSKQLTNQQMH